MTLSMTSEKRSTMLRASYFKGKTNSTNYNTYAKYNTQIRASSKNRKGGYKRESTMSTTRKTNKSKS